MDKLEKVINGMECCIKRMTTTGKCGYDCPYYHNPHGCKVMMLKDAIFFMKAQEPRVMTLTEVYTADFVYIEFDGVITPALRTSNGQEGHRSYFATRQLGGGWMQWDTYGIIWRCWTSRPTDQQRKAVKWDV